MSVVIRKVAIPAGQTVAVIPPDGRAHDGQWDWRVFNPAGGVTVDLVDTAAKTVGDGRALAAGTEWQALGRDAEVWAAAPGGGAAGGVVVTGTQYGD